MDNPNSAYYFDGIDDYINIPGGASTNLNPSSALSVAMYFYPTRHQVSTMVGKVNVDGVFVSQVNTPFTTLNQCLNADIQIGSWWTGILFSFRGRSTRYVYTTVR